MIQAVRQRRMALGSFRELAPASAVPAVVTVENLTAYDEDIAEACFEQKYVSPGWGKSLGAIDAQERAAFAAIDADVLHSKAGMAAAEAVAEFAASLAHA